MDRPYKPVRRSPIDEWGDIREKIKKWQAHGLKKIYKTGMNHGLTMSQINLAKRTLPSVLMAKGEGKIKNRLRRFLKNPVKFIKDKVLELKKPSADDPDEENVEHDLKGYSVEDLEWALAMLDSGNLPETPIITDTNMDDDSLSSFTDDELASALAEVLTENGTENVLELPSSSLNKMSNRPPRKKKRSAATDATGGIVIKGSTALPRKKKKFHKQ